MKGLIASIQRFSLQDGPGIRTTIFLKGCPLRCKWCSNPETQDPKPQLSFKRSPCLREDCDLCVRVCRDRAFIKTKNGISIDPEQCSLCGDCFRECPEMNLWRVGQEWRADELLTEVLKDEIFYKHSGGGVTLSGGEPLLQRELCVQLLKGCKEHHLHTVIDTSAAVDWESIEAVKDFTDLFYVDLKHVDDDIHRRYAGGSNQPILENIRRMAKEFHQEKVAIRIPFIPGVNNDEKSIEGIASFIKSLDTPCPVHLLPYHRLGERKYGLLGLKYGMEDIHPPAPEEIKRGLDLYHKFEIEISPVL